MKDVKPFAIALGIVIVLIAAFILTDYTTGYAVTSTGAKGTGVVGGLLGGTKGATGAQPPLSLCDNKAKALYDTDKDGDYVVGQTTCKPNFDCDDNDATINHLANEIPGDGINNDCDSRIDESDPYFETIVMYHNPSPDFENIFYAVSKTATELCRDRYGFKGATSVGYMYRFEYFNSVDDCKKSALKETYVDTAFVPMPTNQALFDYNGDCKWTSQAGATAPSGGSVGWPLSSNPGINGAVKVGSNIVLICFR